jgi:ubiquinol-cytochrome c reductase cytochrome c subunit
MSVGAVLRSIAHLGGPLSPARRRVLGACALVCGVLALTSFDANAESHPTSPPVGVAAPTSSAGLVARGHSLFLSSCAACHGVQAQGMPGRAPSLRGVGALAADFYLETGRMPLSSPREEPTRTRPAFPQSDIRALVAFVASFGGPPIPTVDVMRGSLAEGHDLFAMDCAGCHTIQARGGVVTGAAVPALSAATPRQIAEAIRIGPYAMPHFSPDEISASQIDSIARYVQSTDHPQDPGGWSIGRVGPITEGMVAWLLAIASLLLIARLLGERTAAHPHHDTEQEPQ